MPAQARVQAQVQALYHLVGIVRTGHDGDGDHDGDGYHGGQKNKDFDLKCISPHIIVWTAAFQTIILMPVYYVILMGRADSLLYFSYELSKCANYEIAKWL